MNLLNSFLRTPKGINIVECFLKYQLILRILEGRVGPFCLIWVVLLNLESVIKNPMSKIPFYNVFEVHKCHPEKLWSRPNIMKIIFSYKILLLKILRKFLVWSTEFNAHRTTIMTKNLFHLKLNLLKIQ